MTNLDSREMLRFRDFELDVAAYELRRRGRPVRLERLPMDLLILLVERRGLLVSRGEIVDRLWGKDVFVDVDTGVHTAIRKIRQALRDSSEAPAFIETVTGKGYRFIADVEVVSAGPSPGPAAPHPGPPSVPAHPSESTATPAGLEQARSSHTAEAPAAVPSAPQRSGRSRVLLVLGVAAVAMVAVVLAWTGLGRGAPPSRVTLAVLPFENLGSDPEREYLAAGLTEETGASLAQIDPGHLIVKGRTLRYRGTRKSVAEIGRELAVDYLVESSIRAEGSRLRVTAKLIRVRDQEHVWSQSYEREPTSLLGLEEELSSAIAEQVRLRVLPDPVGHGRRQSQNAEAYDAYLRGRYFEKRRTPENNTHAIQQYERAIALDPSYALAWSHLSLTYTGSTQNGDARPLDVWPRAREAAAQALRANPQLSEAQLAVGYVNWLMDWDWKAAETAFRRAVDLDPSNAAAHRTLGHALSQLQLDDEAKAALRRARELEPLEPMSYALSAQVAFQAGEYSDAVDYGRRAVRVDSAFWIGHIELAQAYAQLGTNDLALEALTDATRLSGGNSKTISLRGYLLGSMGRADEAREILRLLEATSRQRYVPPYAIALVHAGLGQRGAALEWLDKAYGERDVNLIFLPVDPKWDPYREDARFAALLARCGFTSGSAAPASR